MEIYNGREFCDIIDDVDPCAAYVNSYVTTVEARNEWEKLTLAEQLDRIATTPKKRMRTNAPRFTAVKLGGKSRGITYCNTISAEAPRARNERLLCVERTAKAALAALQREPPLDAPAPAPAALPPKKAMRGFAVASWRVR